MQKLHKFANCHSYRINTFICDLIDVNDKINCFLYLCDAFICDFKDNNNNLQ
jgi:hypothetical protein